MIRRTSVLRRIFQLGCSTQFPSSSKRYFKQFVNQSFNGTKVTQSEVEVLGLAELGIDASLPLTSKHRLDIQSLHEILMEGVCHGKIEAHQRLRFLVPSVDELVTGFCPELLAQIFVMNTRNEETPSSTTFAEIEHRTTLPFLALFRVLELIFFPEKSKEGLLTSILTEARGTSSVQAVRVKN